MSMRLRRARSGLAAATCLALASCTIAPQAVIRNASGAELLLWPLASQPLPLKPGETSRPIIYTAHERQQALIERGNCLYTYPAPDYFKLPKGAKDYASRVVVVIAEDMRLHLHHRSKKGVEGAEIVAAGFPLSPETFCGRRSAG